MPVWLVPVLIRYVLPAILRMAVKSGFINEVEKQLISFGLSLKTYSAPADFPDAPPEVNMNRNFNRGD